MSIKGTGTFLGRRDKDGNEMHCAHAKCPHESMCRNGCICPITLKVHRIEYDGFEGVEIGSYITLEGKRGVVLQQVGTKVVHVYGRKWLA
jgi:hypothetical protein